MTARAGRGRPGRPYRRPAPDAARLAAYDLLRAVEDRDAYANLVLPGLLRDRGITGRDAAFATELAYGTLRGLGLYDPVVAACSDRPLELVDPPVRDVLRLGVHQLLALRVPSHAAVAATVELARAVVGDGRASFVNAVLRRVSGRDLDTWVATVAPDRDADPIGHLAVARSHPRWVVQAFRDALGSLDEAAAVLAADNLAPRSRSWPGRAAWPCRPGRRWGRARAWSPLAARLPGGDPLGPRGGPLRPGRRPGRGQPAGRARARGRPGRGPRLPPGWTCAPVRAARPRCSPGWAASAARRSSRSRRSPTAPRSSTGPCTPVRSARRHRRHRRQSTPSRSWRTAATARGDPAASTGSWPTCRAPASVPCGAVPRPAGAAAPPTSRPSRRCSATCSAPPPTRSGPAVSSRTSPARPTSARPRPSSATSCATGPTSCRSTRGVPPRRPGLGAGPYVQLWPHRHGTDAMFLALLRRTGVPADR